jgi:hypothetical protein
MPTLILSSRYTEDSQRLWQAAIRRCWTQPRGMAPANMRRGRSIVACNWPLLPPVHRNAGQDARKEAAMEPVRMTLRGPAPAVLILTEWLHQQAPHHPPDDPPFTLTENSVDLTSETAAIGMELPCDLVYRLVSDPPPATGRLIRVAGADQPEGAGGRHVATYLLRLELRG